MCDRVNDRIQIFEKDGTFVKEFQIEPQTRQNGSVWDLVLSEDSAQRYIFIADGANMQVLTIDRQSGERLSSFGRPGHMAGNFKWVHNLAIDSKGRSIRPRLAMAAECRSSSAKTECAAKAAVTWLLYLNPQCLWGYTGRGKTYVSTGKDDSKSNCRRRGIISPKSDQEPRTSTRPNPGRSFSCQTCSRLMLL